MNPNAQHNLDIICTSQKNGEKLRALTTGGAQMESFGELISRVLEFSEPLNPGRPESSDSENFINAAPVNYESKRQAIMQLGGQTLELSFFTYLPRTNHYYPSVVANWYLVSESDKDSNQEQIVLQEHLSENHLNKHGVSYKENSGKLLGLLGDAVEVYEAALFANSSV